MWILKSLEPGGDTHYLLPDKEYVVGRKNCDFLIPNDQSISRAHAQLIVTDQTLTLKDSSKYGTSVNNQRLADNQTLRLNSGDNVTFGVFQSKFSVDFEKVVVCSSCLDNNAKMLLSQALLPLGGKLVNAWTQECTHLVMPSVKVTIKTICALLCCRPIIKQEFFTELSKAMQQKSLPPKPENFIPEIDEPSLNGEEVDLRAKQKRKQLFAGKTFIFLSTKQLKRLTSAVSFGGGRSQLLDEGSLPRSLLESPQTCVVDIATANSQIPHPASTTEWANSVRLILQEKGLRFITESEIGLAAIYASCEKYCNPSNPLTDSVSVQSVRPRISSATLSQNAVEETVLPVASQNVTVYVANTEPTQVCDTLAVGETVSSSLNTVEDTALHTKKPKALFQDKKKGNTRFLTSPKANGGTKTSPQKKKLSTQASPQKQSTLNSFFQTVNKKRPREEEPCALQSDPKRTLPPTSIPAHTPKTSHISKQTPSKTTSVKSTTGRTQSRSDLFTGQSEVLSDGVSHPAQQGAQGRKRKEMEELESIMSEDMAFPEWVSHPAKHGEQNKKKKEMEELESLMSEDMDLPVKVPHHAKKREQDRKELMVEGLHMEELESIMSEDIALPDGVSHPAKQGEQGRGRKEMEERIRMEELESIMSEDMALPDGVSLPLPQEAQGKKRKDMQTEIQMEELESIMSEDMDCLDDDALASHSQKANQNVAKGSSDQKQQLNSVKHSSTQKRPWADPEENNSNRRPSVSLDIVSVSHTKQSLKVRKHTSSTEKQQLCPSEQATANQRLSKSSEKGPPAKKNQHDSEPFSRDVGQPVEVKETPPKPTVVTQDAPMTEAEDHLPRKLVVVEFKSLTITAPPRKKVQEKKSNGFTKNFKHFRKVPVPSAVGAPQAIGLIDLMAYSRGRNSELEEWFKETAQGERQSREDEILGDDLFRYNPTKTTKRR